MGENLFVFRRYILICTVLLLMPTFAKANTQEEKDADTHIFQYTTLADNCIKRFEIDKSKIYLDSASMFIKNVDKPLLHGFYHHILGNYYTMERNDTLAHENYYEAINWYEESDQYDCLNPVFYELAYTFYQKQDAVMLGRIASIVNLISYKSDNQMDVLDRIGINGLYYHCLYLENKKNTAYLDSAVYYETEFANMIESDSSLEEQRGDGAFNYMLLALCMTKSNKYSPDSISRYLVKAKELTSPLDTAMIVNLCYMDGEMAFKKNNFEEAEKIYKKVLDLMGIWSGNDNQSLYIDIYSRLSEIAEHKQDLLSAVKYEREKSDWSHHVFDEETNKIISELNEKYLVEKKDTEIEHLNVKNRLYMGITVLGLLVFFFSFRWFMMRKKVAESKLQIEKLGKEKLEAEMRLKDERLKKAELEKYETLLELYFKNRQISEADDTLMGLKNEQKKLSGDLQKYAERLTQYEQMKFVSSIEDPYFNNIANDVYTLISKRINDSNTKDVYFEVLKELKDNFFMNLINAFQGELSVINIKYCIGFAIGMSAKHIADCFSIELYTVHKIRHRLKTKLNLDKSEDIDFNLYLRQLNN